MHTFLGVSAPGVSGDITIIYPFVAFINCFLNIVRVLWNGRFDLKQ